MLNNINEFVKAQLEVNVGCYIFETLFEEYDFDLRDAFEACNKIMPPTYICSRGNYFFFSY